MSLRDAWAALDAARIPAWRRWKENFHIMQRQGVSFAVAEEWSAWILGQELEPFYNAVMEAHK